MTIDPPEVSGPPEENAEKNASSGVGLSRVLEQPFDVFGLYQLRATVGAYSADLGAPPGLVNDIVIAVHELATNTVRHGPGRGRLRMWRSAEGLICEVADSGIAWGVPVRPEVAVAGNGELPWPVKPGHGLWLVRKVAEEVTVRHDERGVTVTISFAVD